uniref:Uncharacterized protein n=1 Tax=Arundo donax TaxID=35708 RepID=A0A0A9BL86_ARUDO
MHSSIFKCTPCCTSTTSCCHKMNIITVVTASNKNTFLNKFIVQNSM